jgi:hypothetical protein
VDVGAYDFLHEPRAGYSQVVQASLRCPEPSLTTGSYQCDASNELMRDVVATMVDISASYKTAGYMPGVLASPASGKTRSCRIVCSKFTTMLF